MEEWRWIPGFEGLYEASSEGRIKSYVKRWSEGKPHIMTPVRSGVNYKRSGTYWAVTLHKNGVLSRCVVHRLVYKTFFGIPNGFHINHIDGNKQNNSLSNLELCTPKENSAHAWKNRLLNPPPIYKGASHPRANIDEKTALAIATANRSIPSSRLANDLGVSVHTVRNIRAGKAWKWLTQDL